MAQLSDLKKSYQQLSTEERMALTMAIRLSRRTAKARVNGKKPRTTSSTTTRTRTPKAPMTAASVAASLTPEQLAAMIAALGGDE